MMCCCKSIHCVPTMNECIQPGTGSSPGATMGTINSNMLMSLVDNDYMPKVRRVFTILYLLYSNYSTFLWTKVPSFKIHIFCETDYSDL